MKGTLGLVLLVCSPFILAGCVLGAIKLSELYAKWSYARVVEKRNAKIERLGLKPFRGTKQYIEEDVDYSTGRDAYRFKKGVHR